MILSLIFFFITPKITFFYFKKLVRDAVYSVSYSFICFFLYFYKIKYTSLHITYLYNNAEIFQQTIYRFFGSPLMIIFIYLISFWFFFLYNLYSIKKITLRKNFFNKIFLTIFFILFFNSILNPFNWKLSFVFFIFNIGFYYSFTKLILLGCHFLSWFFFISSINKLSNLKYLGFYLFFTSLLISLWIALCITNIVMMVILLEISTYSFLIIFLLDNSNKSIQIKNAWTIFIIMTLATLFLFLGIILIEYKVWSTNIFYSFIEFFSTNILIDPWIYNYFLTNNFYIIYESWSLYYIMDFFFIKTIPFIYYLGFFFLMLGFFIKLGLFPFHWWIPKVYSQMSIPALTIFAITIKVGTFFIVANIFWTYSWIFNFWFFKFFFICLILTIFVGILGLLKEINLKKFFALSSIANMGWILLSFCFFKFYLSLFFMFLYIIHSFLFLGLLFFYNYKYLCDLQIDIKNYFLKNNLNYFFMKFFWSFLFFSFAGLPPLLNFLPKLGLFYELINLLDKLLGSAEYIFVLISLLSLIVISILGTLNYLRLIINLLFLKNNKLQISYLFVKILRFHKYSHTSFINDFFFMFLNLLIIFLLCLMYKSNYFLSILNKVNIFFDYSMMKKSYL